MRPEVKRIELEDYQDFLSNPHCKDFTIKQLNQIIEMHGFFKLHNRPKTDLLEVLSSMKLVNPQRSTLDAKILPCCSWPTVDTVNHDLDDLGWRECSVQSIETLDLTEEDHHPTQINGLFKPIVKKVRSKRRRRRRFDSVDINIDNHDGCAAFDAVDLDVDSLLDQLSSGPLA